MLCCPSCRAHHPVNQVSQFPISYTIEAFVKKIKTEGAQQSRSPKKWASSSRAAGSSTQRGVKRKLESLLEEEKCTIATMTTLWKDVDTQLDEYIEQLNKWELQHNTYVGVLSKLEKQQLHAMRLLRKEKVKVQNIKKDGNEAVKQLENVQRMINVVKKPQEYITTIELADNCSESIETWHQKCQENFPNVETVTFTEKVRNIAFHCHNMSLFSHVYSSPTFQHISLYTLLYSTPLKG